MKNGILLAVASLLFAFIGVFIAKNIGIFSGSEMSTSTSDVNLSEDYGFIDPITFPDRYPDVSWSRSGDQAVSDSEEGVFELIGSDEVVLSVPVIGKSWTTLDNFLMSQSDTDLFKREILYKNYVVRGIVADGLGVSVNGYVLMSDDMIQTVVVHARDESTTIFVSDPVSLSEAQRVGVGM